MAWRDVPFGVANPHDPEAVVCIRPLSRLAFEVGVAERMPGIGGLETRGMSMRPAFRPTAVSTHRPHSVLRRGSIEHSQVGDAS
jgi:hypothetical protein